MNTELFAIIALFILGFGLISGRIEKSVITPPMAFVIFGILLSPQLLGLLNLEVEHELVRIIAEFTLILVLFTDASRINLKLLRRDYNLPVRLLGIGLPLTIILGTILAVLLLGGRLEFWEAAALATILAPTDAALGQAVVSSRSVPICIRQSLNVESGLNDGICLPILLIFLSLAGTMEGTGTASFWFRFAAMQVILGPIVGVAVGYIGGWLVSQSVRRKWITHSFEDLSVLGLSLCAYAIAELVGGNGFIAAFCAGLTLGNTAPSICDCLYEFGEAEGQLLVLLIFMIYGSMMVFPALDSVNWQMVLYAIATLTIARMVGVAISVIGMKLRWYTILFLGWFGPRGVASILYGLLILEGDGIQGSEVIFSTMVLTVLISVFAHGLTAFPGANWYGNRMARFKATHEIPELMPRSEMPVRLSWRK
ncbi:MULTISPECIES: sodium:proton antiporter [unclassified Moorena]|uniref:cation:proton antiporter n=1 Tax=unclassified Moorena TaxID=2683338 RepID=UPI0014003161|nr:MULTISPECIES: sodium:proton antiporter [unclassified Moorena]NEO12445.1 sodium:proton antiporter [Moorena sp. SIO3E8]NEP99294.1 sodium:proton antiporter [Moorena sp. SIO3F7]